MNRKAQVEEILKILAESYPDAQCSLGYHDVYELAVATILSAQCTDKRVNLVTPGLFRKYPDFKALSEARLPELMALIKSTGFYRNKARNLLNLGKQVTDKYSGKLPDDMDSLVDLPGIGRKTANCILGNGFGKALGIVVDTHVKRLCYRMGLSKHKDPEKVEKDLLEILPRQSWIMFPHYLILHGRQVCSARKPDCEKCRIIKFCERNITGSTAGNKK